MRCLKDREKQGRIKGEKMMANKSGWKNQQSKHQRRNHHLREIILAILVVLSVAATVSPYSAQAATPKVLVSGYKVSAATIY